jgi:hypothetical protein
MTIIYTTLKLNELGRGTRASNVMKSMRRSAKKAPMSLLSGMLVLAVLIVDASLPDHAWLAVF